MQGRFQRKPLLRSQPGVCLNEVEPADRAAAHEAQDLPQMRFGMEFQTGQDVRIVGVGERRNLRQHLLAHRVARPLHRTLQFDRRARDDACAAKRRQSRLQGLEAECLIGRPL